MTLRVVCLIQSALTVVISSRGSWKGWLAFCYSGGRTRIDMMSTGKKWSWRRPATGFCSGLLPFNYDIQTLSSSPSLHSIGGLRKTRDQVSLIPTFLNWHWSVGLTGTSGTSRLRQYPRQAIFIPPLDLRGNVNVRGTRCRTGVCKSSFPHINKIPQFGSLQCGGVVVSVLQVVGFTSWESRPCRTP